MTDIESVPEVKLVERDGELYAYCGQNCSKVMRYKTGNFSCYGCGAPLQWWPPPRL